MEIINEYILFSIFQHHSVVDYLRILCRTDNLEKFVARIFWETNPEPRDLASTMLTLGTQVV